MPPCSVCAKANSVTQYNPIVKNPNTDSQQTQRAKFKLMSQLAAVMAPGFGTMSVTSRKAKGKPSQRNAFTQLNFPLVEVTSEDETVRATIPMEQVKLTSSFRALPIMTVAKNTATSINVVMDDIAGDVSTLRVIVLAYPSANNTTQVQISSITDFPVEEGSIDQTINVESAGKYTVLAYGLIPSESAKASMNIDNIHTPADEDFVSAVELNAMVAAGEMVETVTVGRNVNTAA